MNAEAVSEGFRDCIRAAIRDEGSQADRTFWPRWPLAGAALLLLGLSAVGALQLWNPAASSSEVVLTANDLTLSEQVAAVLKIGISDHIHCVVELHSDEDLLGSEQIAQKMGPDFEGLVPLLRSKLPEGFIISVGHRCDVNDRAFVHMIVKHSVGKAVSVIITDREGLNFPKTGARVSSVEADGITLHQDRLQSLEVVGFQAKSHLVFIVSSLDHEENLQIANLLAPAVSDFLKQL